jgi:hypothetical protein
VKTLSLLRQVRKSGRHAGLKLRCCFRAIALPQLVFTSGDEECLLGTEAAFFDSNPNFFPQLGGRVSKVARNRSFNHEN